MRIKIGCIVLFFVLFICGCGGSTAYTVPYESNSNQMEGRSFDDENDNESEIKSGKEKKDSSKKNKPLVTRKTIIKEDSGVGYEYSYYNYDYDSKNRITSEKYYDIEEAGYYTTNGDIVYLTFTAKLSAEGMYALYDANGKSVFFENINDATIYATAECIEMDDKLLLSNVFLGDVKDPE